MAKKKSASKRTKALPKRGKLFFSWKWYGATFVVAILLWLVSLQTLSIAYFLAPLGFVIKHIDVEGRHQTRGEDILAALNTKAGDPILMYSPETLKSRVEKVSWVRSASVQRRLPHTLYIKITERRPMALWQNQGKFFVVDQEGVVIQNASIEDYDYLLLIVGEMTPDKTSQFLSELAHVPGLEGRIQAATLVDGRRWNVRLENNIDVFLPEETLEQALQKLLTLIEEDHILERNIRSIDLRQTDKTLVRLGEGISLRSRALSRAT